MHTFTDGRDFCFRWPRAISVVVEILLSKTSVNSAALLLTITAHWPLVRPWQGMLLCIYYAHTWLSAGNCIPNHDWAYLQTLGETWSHISCIRARALSNKEGVLSVLVGVNNRGKSIERYIYYVQYVCGDFQYSTCDHSGLNNGQPCSYSSMMDTMLTFVHQTQPLNIHMSRHQVCWSVIGHIPHSI